MMKKLLSAILAISMLCLLVGCSQNTPAASSTPAPAASASPPQAEPAQPEPAQPDASASASTPDASTSENLPDEKTAANQVSRTGLLTGAFLNDAERAKDNEGASANDQLTYVIGAATIISARFETRHGTEAFMDEYAAGSDVGEPQDIDVAGTTGTRYHWETGSNEDASVIDAVVTEANGASLLFLVKNSKDAAAGYTDAGPVQEAVDSWLSSLMVAE